MRTLTIEHFSFREKRRRLGEHSSLARKPGNKRIQQFSSNLDVVSSAARRHVEAVIGLLEKFQCGERIESLTNVLKQVQFGEFIARALKKEHRYFDVG